MVRGLYDGLETLTSPTFRVHYLLPCDLNVQHPVRIFLDPGSGPDYQKMKKIDNLKN